MSSDQEEVRGSLSTKLLFSSDAQRALFEGIKEAAKAVGCTLGPRGKTVLIQNGDAPPVATKDGVTVSRSIRPKDPVKRMGARLVTEAASRTNDVAGDGTTTATVLTEALIEGGIKLLAGGYSNVDVCRGLEAASRCIDDRLVAMARKVESNVEVKDIATISANGDQTIGSLIAEVMMKVGNDGIITVEEAKGTATSSEVVEGMQFERGYLSPFFVTNADRMHASYNDCLVLVANKKLSSLKELIPVLEAVAREQKSLLIIAEDVEGEALHALVLNKAKGALNVVAVKAPGYGNHRQELLEDICVLTGATLVSPASGVSIESLTTKELGRVKRALVDAKYTTLVGTGSTKDAIEKHAAMLRTRLEDVSLTTDDITKLRVRLAKLSNGVGVVRVGGVTELEMIEKKHRIEDALNATKAAASEGIVIGGGMALARVHWSLKGTLKSDVADVERGMTLALSSCLSPLKKILQNAGNGKTEAIVERLSNSESQTEGYDAARDTYVDMFAEGIIDPVKVTRSAFRHAISVAITFLSLDAVVYDDDGK